MSQISVVLSGHDLVNDPLEKDCDGGVFFKAQRRIVHEMRRLNRKGELSCGLELPDYRRRQILIGELGELAVARMYENRGFQVIQNSWNEFKEKRQESSTDLTVLGGQKALKIQVKSSELANRCVQGWRLDKYIRDGIDFCVFVAIREIECDNGRAFYCEQVSCISPQNIKAFWRLTDGGSWLPQNNDETTFLWKRASNYDCGNHDVFVCQGKAIDAMTSLEML